VPRFDVLANPNPKGSHALYLDVQSDLVQTSTRWCVPLMAATPERPILTGAHVVLDVAGQPFILDTPNMLAVPLRLLRKPLGRVEGEQQLAIEAALDFMLRGY